jgi:hypothetical protein
MCLLREPNPMTLNQLPGVRQAKLSLSHLQVCGALCEALFL